jgi:DME family drug/metabolite transporter
MVLLVLAGVLWGTGGLFGSLLAARTGLSPLAVAGYRLAVGGALLLALPLLSGRGSLRGGRRGAGSPRSARSPRCSRPATSPRSR